MITPSSSVQVLVATKPVDFRRGADGLAAYVQEQMKIDPFCGTIYVFRAKRADRVKSAVVGRGPASVCCPNGWKLASSDGRRSRTA